MPTAELNPVRAPYCDTCGDRSLYVKDVGWCHTDENGRPISDMSLDTNEHKAKVTKWLWEYWKWQFMEHPVPPNALDM